jgi:enoyl-CoA hydratase/carnithine racemase
MSDLIRSSLDEHVLSITINRPQRKNSLTGEMYDGLAQALSRAEHDDLVRVVLLRGSEGVFCAGNDISDFVESPPAVPDAPAWKYFERLMHLTKPVIAAVDGPAVGVGTTTLLHCDLVYASDRAWFSLPFTSLGITPEGASSVLLPLFVGRQRASEALLFGKVLTAEKAFHWGLVNEVVEHEMLLAVATERARTLALQPAGIMQRTKRLIQNGVAQLVSAHYAAEKTELMQTVAGPAAQEAFERFLTKSRS